MLRPVCADCLTAPQHQRGAWNIDGEPDAAEHAPETTVQVEKPKMQARRRNDAHGAGRWAASRCGAALCGRLGLRCVGQWHYGQPDRASVPEQ
jgi:hypothetical protein